VELSKILVFVENSVKGSSNFVKNQRQFLKGKKNLEINVQVKVQSF